MSNKVAIIASNGGLFDAYKVFNIATAAAATEKEVTIFFTFEGLNLIHKQGMQALPMPEGREAIAVIKIPTINVIPITIEIICKISLAGFDALSQG